MSIFVSFYYFLLDWFFTEDEIRFCDMVEILLYKRSVPIWKHYFGWFEAAKKYPNQILWIFFEDLVAKPENCIRKIAEFINISDNKEERIKTATELSSFKWMKENEHLFDESPSKNARNHVFGAVGEKASKIRTGKTSVDSIEPLLKEEIETILRSNFNALFGVETYSELRQLVIDSDINVLTV